MNWLKQTSEPLFPDVLWSRPENRRYAGKLLIIGGHKQSFNEVSAAYLAAVKAGAGTVRVILPDSLQKMLSKVFPEAEYAASTPIGSFSRQALGTLLDAAQWADAVLLAGDFGRNSETAVLLEGIVEKYQGKLAIAGDAIDYFLSSSNLGKRKDTLAIAPITQLQKLAAPHLIQQNADFIKVVEQVSNYANATGLNIVTNHSNQVLVAVKEQISTTPAPWNNLDYTNLAAYATVWWLQQPEKPFEALTTTAWCLSREL